MKDKRGIMAAGAIIGALAVILVQAGNPVNYGLCIACFIRDTVGALGLHRAQVVQYIRPEVLGIGLGAFLMAVGKKEFTPRGGSSPLTRFVLGFFVIIGALMFLGCPLRMVLRLAGGDLNAVFGLLGFIGGIVTGIFFLNRGFSLKRTYTLPVAEGLVFPGLNFVLLVLLVAAPVFIFFSVKGPGSAHAPVWLSLLAGMIVGVAAQRTRLCLVGGIRDVLLFKNWYLLSGFLAIFITALAGNLIVGKFTPGFAGQSIAHTDGLWNFLGMLLAGWGSVLLGGCPLRQLIMSGEGNTDAVIAVLGMAAGAAFAHNFGLASSAEGPAFNGQIAVVIGFIVVLAIAYLNIDRDPDIKMKGGIKIDRTAN